MKEEVIDRVEAGGRGVAGSQEAIARTLALLRQLFPFPAYAEVSEEAGGVIATTVMKFLPPGAAVLDFGCGPMYKTAVLQGLGYRCTATDDLQDDCFTPENVDKMLDFARSQGIHFVLAGKEKGLPPGAFDLVTVNDVLEHLHDSPRELLNDLISLVRPQGYLLVTVPNAANIRKRIALLRGRTNLPRFASFYWSQGHWRGHVREYVKDDLLALVRFLNLKPVELRSYHHMIFVLPRPLQPLYRAISCVFPGWRDSWLLLAQKPPDWQPQRVLPSEWKDVRDEMAGLNTWGC